MLFARIWVSEGAAGLLHQQELGFGVWRSRILRKNKGFRRVSFMPWDVGVQTHDHCV